MDLAIVHRSMAFGVVGIVLLVGIESASRAVTRRPPGRLSAWLSAIASLALVVTIGFGLALLFGGSQPAESLHFMYAVLALAAIPIVQAYVPKDNPRRLGWATLLGVLLTLVLIWRLFSTG